MSDAAGRLTTEQLPNRCPQLAARPGWHGPCHAGHSRCVKAVKRAEAGQRERKRAAVAQSQQGETS